MPYATNTIVTVDKTKGEIEKLLTKYGATGFASGWNEDSEHLFFHLEGRQIRFTFARLQVKDLDQEKIEAICKRRKIRLEEAAQIALEQANRTRWRELLLGIKAKLVLVDAGITTTEEEFLAHIVLPDGQTMGQWAKPRLYQAYLEGKMLPMLPRGKDETK